ncbi:MAG: hypothetical protein IJ981_04665 [Clostridia bacterium]|nr:hypothetical protein [Clostridia bacterium]
MKRLLSILLSAIVVVGCVPLLSACDNHLVYNHYYFDLAKGEFEKDNYKITMSEVSDSFTLLDKNGTKTINYSADSNVVKTDDDITYYRSQYFIASSLAMVGKCSTDSDGQVLGNGVMNGTSVVFKDGAISLHDNILGYYECFNNYITITYNGTVNQYLILPITDSETKNEVGFFKDFYANVKVVAKPVEYTGFKVDTEVITNGESGRINAYTYSPNKKIEKKTFTVLDAGGFDIELDQDGKYTLGLMSNKPKDSATIEVHIDGLTSRVKVKPVVVYFDKSKMTEKFVGDEVDLTSSKFYELYNVKFDELKIENLITYGGASAEIVDGKLYCKDKGIVIIRLKATFNYNGKDYVCIDEASINITEDIIEENKLNNEKKVN